MADSEQAPLRFDSTPALAAEFLFSDASITYLTELRSEFALDVVVSSADSDLQRALAAMHWTHARWEHDGANVPSNGDPLSILRAALDGKRFRCVEYSVVLSGVLAALGYRSRVLGLMTADVETCELGAGHVVAEAYLPDLGRWVMLDGEYDALALVHQYPANAVQFAQALSRNEELVEIGSISGTQAPAYVEWIKPYLYYFSASIDNRHDVQRAKGNIRLAPVGAREPKVFQRVHQLPAATVFTHCPSVLYPIFG